METFLKVIHVLDAIVLILIVLLQQGKGAGMGLAFGGGSQTVFGASGGNILTKITAVAATIFMVTSLSLFYLSSRQGASVMRGIKPPAATSETGAVTAPTGLTAPTQPATGGAAQ